MINYRMRGEDYSKNIKGYTSKGKNNWEEFSKNLKGYTSKVRNNWVEFC